jgi:hypothetical protein
VPPAAEINLAKKIKARRSRNQIELELVVELELDFFTVQGG